MRPSSEEEYSSDFRELSILLESAEVLLLEFGKYLSDDVDCADSDVSFDTFEELVKGLATYIDRLMDLVPALENPAVEGKFHTQLALEPEDFHVSSPLAQAHCRRIRDRYKKLPIRWVELLGTANAARTERLQRRRELSVAATVKLEADVESVSEPMFSGSMPTVTTGSRTSYVADSIFDHDDVKQLNDAEKLDDLVSQYTSASFSTAPSIIAQGRQRVPPIPVDAANGNAFNCPFCGLQLFNIDTRRWQYEYTPSDI